MQAVVLNGASSQSGHVISGVPQGSILGPLLFLIYIDDITHANISEASKIVIYADDILLYRPISSKEDYVALQSDIDALSNWTTRNFMTFNTTKCKFMLISRKRSHYVPTTPLSLNGCILEKVPSFKYLGMIISSDLSWSEHIQRACGKARKIIGLLYRRYYHHADSRTLLQLYVSLVRPHVEYAAPVWDPHLAQDINMLENVQKFGLRVSSKQWDTGYSELLNMCNLSTLENRRLYLKLCHLFKIVNGLCYFPSGVIVPRHNPSHAMRPLMLEQPFARTNCFQHSFIPDSVRKWNYRYLPDYVVRAANYPNFKHLLRPFT